MHSRFAVARRLLIFWTLFIGLGAVGGAACMLIDPSGRSVGMDGMLPYFQVLPFADVLFQDLLFSGFALLIVNGLSNLTAAALLFARRKIGAVLGGIFGVTLMLWICIQFYIFPPNFMSTIYFFFGLAQAATGWAAVVFQRQEAFAAEAHEYPNRTGADVYEIRSTERTEGTLGFWWCGRYGMHRWEMPIETPNINLPSYEHVTICAPIWVFALAAPVRTFCRSAKGRIREVDYILVHHTRGLYDNAADEMDALLGLRRTHLTSIRCVTGTYRETRTETK